MNKHEFGLGLVMGVIIMTIFTAVILGLQVQNGIISDRPITPELTITVKDGVADTVWVYRKPVEK